MASERADVRDRIPEGRTAEVEGDARDLDFWLGASILQSLWIAVEALQDELPHLWIGWATPDILIYFPDSEEIGLLGEFV